MLVLGHICPIIFIKNIVNFRNKCEFKSLNIPLILFNIYDGGGLFI